MVTIGLPLASAGPYPAFIGPPVADMPPAQLQKHLISIAFPLTPRRIDMIFPRLATARLSQQYRRPAPFADQ
jgi:hypothetical protein